VKNPTPKWAVTERRPKGVTPTMLFEGVVRVLKAIRGADKVNPAACATDAREVLSLWRALEQPDLVKFANSMDAIAEAARESKDPLFAHDVRWEHKPGRDRSRDVATLCVQKRFGDRLAAAKAHLASKSKPSRPAKGGYRETPENRPPTPEEWHAAWGDESPEDQESPPW